mgnify:CR=1 FL=1
MLISYSAIYMLNIEKRQLRYQYNYNGKLILRQYWTQNQQRLDRLYYEKQGLSPTIRTDVQNTELMESLEIT